jgi:hypothetical protein
MSSVVRAPFTPEVVGKLMRWQSAGTVHEATCPNEHKSNRVLRVSSSGMRCPTCGYLQTFAPAVMLSEPPRQIVAGG